MKFPRPRPLLGLSLHCPRPFPDIPLLFRSISHASVFPFGASFPQYPDKEEIRRRHLPESAAAHYSLPEAPTLSEIAWANPLQKQWYQSVFVLEHPASSWLSGFQLPRPLAYGVLHIAHAGRPDPHVRRKRRLPTLRGRVPPPPLDERQNRVPATCPRCRLRVQTLAAPWLDETIYIAGGLSSPTATAALKTFWALDLTAPSPVWKELEPWPAPPDARQFQAPQTVPFTFSGGTSLVPDADGKPVRQFLQDALRFTPARAGRNSPTCHAPRSPRLPPPQRLEIPTPYPLWRRRHTGQLRPIENHPGFPRDILSYNTQAIRN